MPTLKQQYVPLETIPGEIEAREALAPVLAPEEETSLPASVIRRRKIARALVLGLAMTIASIAVFGASGLAFFTTQQFGLAMGLASAATTAMGFFVCGIIFLAYYATWGKSTWREVKNNICDKFFPLKVKKKTQDELELENDKKKSKLTKTQKAAMSISLLIGLVSMAAIGAGSYLGVMAVGTALGVATAFVPLAIISTICMFVAASAFCLPDMLQQTAKLFAPKSKEKKPKPELTKKQKIKGRLVMVGAWIFAVGATFGFPAFKFFCTTEFFALAGFTSLGATALTGGIAFVTMFVMTALTSGMRLLDRGRAYRRKVEGRAKEGPQTKTVIPNKARYAFGLFVGVSASLFNGVGAYMGVTAIGVVLATAIPAMAIFATPLFMAIGIAIGIWRTVDFWFYSVPGIKQAVGGAKKVEIEKKLEEKQVVFEGHPHRLAALGTSPLKGEELVGEAKNIFPLEGGSAERSEAMGVKNQHKLYSSPINVDHFLRQIHQKTERPNYVPVIKKETQWPSLEELSAPQAAAAG